MTDSQEAPSDHLWWFGQLSLDDRLMLLGDPYGSLPTHLVEMFSRRPGWLTGRAFWVTGSTGGFALAGTGAKQLSDYRDQLDDWWSNLDQADADYIVEHRDGELDDDYFNKVQAVTTLPLQAENPLVYVAVRDNRTGRFQLHGLVSVYVEFQARQRSR